jgi:hypothetical protein
MEASLNIQKPLKVFWKTSFSAIIHAPHPEQPHNFGRARGVSIIMPPAITPWIRVDPYQKSLIRIVSWFDTHDTQKYFTAKL